MFDATIADPILNSHSLVSGLTDLSLLKRSELEPIDLIFASATNQQYWFPQQDSLANLAQLIQQDIEVPVGTFMEKSFPSRLYDQDFRDIDDLTGLERVKDISPRVVLNNTLPTINLRATDATAAETNRGQTANPGRFTLTRTGNLTNALTVNYTIGGTASKGTDYNNLTGRVTFAAGSNRVTININPINDRTVEGNETVVLTLANSANYTVGTANRATVTIADNDLPVITIAATDANAAEVVTGQTPNPGRFTLTRTGSLTNSLTVNYRIAGTATKGTDYNNLTGRVTFAAGSNRAVVNINAIDDTLVEGNETVVLTLANSAKYTVGTANRATVNIADNDNLNPPDNGGTPQWSQQYSYQPSLLESALDLVTANDGSIYATGWMKTSTSEGGNGTDDAWVAKYNAAGQQMWFRQISKPTHFSQNGGTTYGGIFHERAYGISLDAAGNVFVAGTSKLEGLISRENDPRTPDDNTSEYLENLDLFIYKFDGNGTLLMKQDEFTPLHNETVNDIAVDGAGNAYVVGQYDDRAALIKFNGTNGTWLWGQALSNDSKDEARSVAVDRQGFVYVAGDYERYLNNGNANGFGNTNGQYDAWLVKYRGTDGSNVWVKTDLRNTANFDDRVMGMAIDNNGRIYITGSTQTGEFVDQKVFKDSWLLQYNTQGNRGWTRSIPDTSSLGYQFTDVAVDNNGGIYVSAARIDETANRTQGTVIKYNSSNVLQWEGRIGTSGNIIIPYAVAVAGDGSVYLTGQVVGNLVRPVVGQFDIFLTKFSNSLTTTTIQAAPKVNAVESQIHTDSLISSSGEGDSLLSQEVFTPQPLTTNFQYSPLDILFNSREWQAMGETLPYSLARL